MRLSKLSNIAPLEVRKSIRKGELTEPTSGYCNGYAQGNLVILPKKYAYDFLLFTQRNPKPCPVLEVTDIGSSELVDIAGDCDIKTDIPMYRVYKKGVLVDECTNISDYWQDDFVSFVLGCSFTFESELVKHGIPIRHIEEKKNVPMFITNIECKPAGVFNGPTVVSMRPIPNHLISRAVQITSRFPKVHGAPIHIGNPREIGIDDISKPDFGDGVVIKDNETPVFWACGVTPQAVAMNVKPDIIITHSPGYMLITDIHNTKLTVD